MGIFVSCVLKHKQNYVQGGGAMSALCECEIRRARAVVKVAGAQPQPHQVITSGSH